MAKADLTHDASDVIQRTVTEKLDEWGRTPYISVETSEKPEDFFDIDSICKWIIDNNFKKVC